MLDTADAARVCSATQFRLAPRLRPRHRRDRPGVVDPHPRSSLGFKFRAVGENPERRRGSPASSVKNMYVYGMLISGALIGSRRCQPGARHPDERASPAGIDAGIGFDAITVALLGRSTPVGNLRRRNLLFGAFKAGGFAMSGRSAGIPVEIITVVQAAHRAAHRRPAARPHDLLPALAGARPPASGRSAPVARQLRASSRRRPGHPTRRGSPGERADDIPPRSTRPAVVETRRSSASRKTPIALAVVHECCTPSSCLAAPRGGETRPSVLVDAGSDAIQLADPRRARRPRRSWTCCSHSWSPSRSPSVY